MVKMRGFGFWLGFKLLIDFLSGGVTFQDQDFGPLFDGRWAYQDQGPTFLDHPKTYSSKSRPRPHF